MGSVITAAVCVAVAAAIVLLLVLLMWRRRVRQRRALAGGRRQDAWFHHLRPSPGSLMVVRGSIGWGPHNQNEVLYVHSADVVAMVDGRTVSEGELHRRRISRRP